MVGSVQIITVFVLALWLARSLSGEGQLPALSISYVPVFALSLFSSAQSVAPLQNLFKPVVYFKRVS